MTDVKCPSCGAVIRVQEKKTGLWWGIGCLIAALGIPVIVAMIGLIAVIAIPSFVKARGTAQEKVCINQMQLLENAKEQLLLTGRYSTGDVISEEDISQHLENGLDGLKCPGGGTYSINPIGQPPSCSVHGSLPERGE